MGKRSGLLRVAARAHGPSAGGSSSNKKTKIKKKLRVKQKPSAVAASAVTTAATECAASAASDGLFALALPPVAAQVAISIRRSKKKRAKGDEEAVEAPNAFEDSSKNAMFQQILSSAKTSRPSGMIPADEHRARCEELKRVRAERQALKAERFAAHKKC